MIKYLLALGLLVAGCSGDNLSYRAKSAGGHITVEGKSKTDEATAKSAAVINQVVINQLDPK